MNTGGPSKRRPSRFIQEATGILPEPIASARTTDAELISMYAVQPTLPLGRSDYQQPIQLSYGQIDDYLSCPRKYFLLHVLRVPTPQEHPLVYGSAIHAAISEFYTAKLRGKPFSETELAQAFERAWSSEGFHSAEHEDERKRQGRATLDKFWHAHIGDQKPIEVEHEFKFSVGDVSVIGRLDLVMPYEQGAQIIDFKTSAVTEQADADKRAKDSPQLSIYALAYQNRYGELPRRLSLSYVESGLVGSVVRTEEDIETIRKTIMDVAEAIHERRFDPSPTHPKDCICRQYEGLDLGLRKTL